MHQIPVLRFRQWLGLRSVKYVPGLIVAVLLLWSAPSLGSEVKPWFGQLQSGGHLWVETPDGTEVTWDGDTVPTQSPRTLIGLGRNQSGTFTLTRQAPNEAPQSWSVEVASRSYQEQRVKGVPQPTVTPSDEQLARIQAEASLTQAARQTSEPGNAGITMPFAWPLEGRRQSHDATSRAS
ncbi:MAG: hypothetical protein WED11_01990, partial [Natronospirillum sp.]